MRRDNKKSTLGSTLTKSIPLSVAMALLASGNAFAAANDGAIQKIAVNVPGQGTVVVDTEKMATSTDYEKYVKATLKNYWKNAEPIFVSETETSFVDFSKNAQFEMTLDEVKAAAKGNNVQYTDVIDLSDGQTLQNWLYN